MANVFRRLINRVTGRGGNNTPSDGNGKDKGSGGSREPKRGGGGRKTRTQKVKEAIISRGERVKNFIRRVFRRG